MSERATLDHLAIGVNEWRDAYARFAAELGGRWAYGGPSADVASYHLAYRHDMRLEFISPNGADGFMRRFIDRHGPGAHHLTFKVPSFQATVAEVGQLGIGPLSGRTDLAFWQRHSCTRSSAASGRWSRSSRPMRKPWQPSCTPRRCPQVSQSTSSLSVRWPGSG
jgi:hypothetical protein